MSRVDDTSAALFVDLYELTMSASYHAHGLDQPATFDLFARHLPARRGYLVSCGLDAALDYLERLQFDDTALDYLRSLDLFEESFLSMLSELRFTGEVRAIPEGELVFPNEPIVQVTAPLVEAQLVETFLLNCIGYQTMIATKAARVATACGDRTFVDFSPRRDHGPPQWVPAAKRRCVSQDTFVPDFGGCLTAAFALRLGANLWTSCGKQVRKPLADWEFGGDGDRGVRGCWGKKYCQRFSCCCPQLPR